VKISSHTTSQPDHIACPACGFGKLGIREPILAGCDSCGRVVDGAVLRTLEQIVALPNALGRHACECGHPEMRRLPEGVFHCPSCGSEILSFETGASFPNEAYRAGWMDGQLEEVEGMAESGGLAVWRDPYDRHEYYRGHRAGRKVRLMSEDLEGIHASSPP
jgi:ribosomal protein L37AE/L43A